MSASSVLSVIASQYDAYPNRDEFLSLAALRVNRCLFGDKADLATALMAAHFIALSDSSSTVRQYGESGPVTSKKEGDLSISYGGGGTNNKDDLGLTVFGQQFQGLQTSSGLFMSVTGMGTLDGC